MLPDQFDSCLSKDAHDTEDLAREAGRHAMKKREVELWIYPCAYCSRWHLTSRERSPYWHVQTQGFGQDDHRHVVGDPHFWARLVDMPFGEAEQILLETRRAVSEAMQHATGAGQPEVRRFLSRIKDELHFLRGIDQRFKWTRAVAAVCGEEALAQVLEELERINAESRVHDLLL